MSSVYRAACSSTSSWMLSLRFPVGRKVVEGAGGGSGRVLKKPVDVVGGRASLVDCRNAVRRTVGWGGQLVPMQCHALCSVG